jgi:UDP-galactopyranose mutase
LFGVKTPEEAKELLKSKVLDIKSPANLEDWALSRVGEEIYRKFVYGYTKKQWGREPKDLPASIIKRIPIRLDFNDNYFDDLYQGIPIGGYTKMIEQIQEGIEVKLGIDFLDGKEQFEQMAKHIVYTGPIDEFFGYQFGALEYRSLKFETEKIEIDDFQGNALINYTHEDVPYTRICEHKHFEKTTSAHTIITKEYPMAWSEGKERYYPVNDAENNLKYIEYKKLVETISDKYIFGGRLAEYKYYDMHQVIASALSKFKNRFTFEGWTN